ncbi:hypothetical protein ACPF8X_13200 [Streptomyces sp. G35A]
MSVFRLFWDRVPMTGSVGATIRFPMMANRMVVSVRQSWTVIRWRWGRK